MELMARCGTRAIDFIFYWKTMQETVKLAVVTLSICHRRRRYKLIEE